MPLTPGSRVSRGGQEPPAKHDTRGWTSSPQNQEPSRNSRQRSVSRQRAPGLEGPCRPGRGGIVRPQGEGGFRLASVYPLPARSGQTRLPQNSISMRPPGLPYASVRPCSMTGSQPFRSIEPNGLRGAIAMSEQHTRSRRARRPRASGSRGLERQNRFPVRNTFAGHTHLQRICDSLNGQLTLQRLANSAHRSGRF